MRKRTTHDPPGSFEVLERTRSFFGAMRQVPDNKALLREQNHRIEFDLEDGAPFYVEIMKGRVRVRPGICKPRRFDRPDLIHFRLRAKTLRRLLEGEIRFTDALIPTDPTGQDRMLLLECGLFKWSALNWVGRLFRAGQLPRRFLD